MNDVVMLVTIALVAGLSNLYLLTREGAAFWAVLRSSVVIGVVVALVLLAGRLAISFL